jgi:hypothetical protein
MRVFVDFVDPSGSFSTCSEPSTVDEHLPLDVFTTAVFLDAVRKGGAAPRVRLFHIEGARFLDGGDLGEAEVGELDTLIVVNTEDHRFHVAEALASLWVRRGGSTRRVTHMPIPPRPRVSDWGVEVTTIH